MADKLTGTFVQIYKLDASGNAEDGFDINDIVKGDIFEVPDNYNSTDLFELLKAQKFLKKYVNEDDLDINMDETFTEIFDAVTEEPLWQFWDIRADDAIWNAKNGTNVYNLDGERLITYSDGTFEFGGV